MSNQDISPADPVFQPKPDLAPPATSVGVIGWLRNNLFPDWWNSILTVLGVAFAVWVIWSIFTWAIYDGHFVGSTRDVCKPNFQIAKEEVVLPGYLPDGSVVDIKTTADRVVVPDGVEPNMRWTTKDVTRTVRVPGTREFAKVVVNQDVVIEGACWIVVSQRVDQFIYGFYPKEERWRPTLVVGLGLILLIYMLTDGMPFRGWVALTLAIPFPIAAFILLSGGMLGLEYVDNAKWGGLLLTIVISAVAISGALPLGVALALGRRSQMPIVRMFCIMFIEFFRAVPMITILFMSIVILPLFLPPGTSFDQLLRVLIGVTVFIAAYTAEVVRGGLQAIPKGQYEAAAALGLGYWRMMGLIILPQALKIMIPAIVSLFIGIFKDTTLVVIVGLSDLLQMAQLAVADAQWTGLAKEVYVFCAIIFFIFCFAMSRYSMYLERKLHTGHSR